MISILKSVTELDRLQDLLEVSTDCYSLAIRSVSQYAPEIDPNQIAEFRTHLKDLDAQWRAARSSDGLRAVQASLRGELREYRDQTREQLARLRLELEGAAAAMASFAAGITSGSSDCAAEMKRELKRLGDVGSSSDLLEIRRGIQAAAGEIAGTLDQLQRGNQLIVAQLQDEIRVLHQEFQAERRVLFTDPVSGAWTRQKLDVKLNEMLRQDDRFCLISVGIRNLSRIKADYSPTLVEAALKAMLTRFRGMFGDDTSIGRWTEDQFVVILDVEPSAIGVVAKEVARKLSGPYSAQENGIAHNLQFDLATSWLERSTGSDPASFIRQLDRMTHSLLR